MTNTEEEQDRQDIQLLDRLQRDGFTPVEDGDWFDRTDSLRGGRTIRVAFDDTDTLIYGFDHHMVEEWSARFSCVPEPLLMAALDQAVAWGSPGMPQR